MFLRIQANKTPKEIRMLQWTVFIYVFAIIDGQPLYDNADVRDMCNVYQQETYCKLTNMHQHACFCLSYYVAQNNYLAVNQKQKLENACTLSTLNYFLKLPFSRICYTSILYQKSNSIKYIYTCLCIYI